MDRELKKIKGFADLFQSQSSIFTKLESAARHVFTNYNYSELRTPILEYTSLFKRSIGVSTDVVQKEMFTFEDRKGRSLTLRPEATAGVMRAVIEANLDKDNKVHKFFSIGPMFRYERPQKGRMRQFHQINCECLGSSSPYVDAELICMLMNFLDFVNIKNTVLRINSLGCSKCRPLYLINLSNYLKNINEKGLCEDCKNRKRINPLRILDCKEKSCQEVIKNVPHLLDNNCDSCKNHFQKVIHILDQNNIKPVIDHNLVRGLDYYSQTTFEVVSDQIGAQTAIAGGGRYNGLIQQLGGKDIPGIGFACGMERLELLIPSIDEKTQDFFLACLDESTLDTGFQITEELRRNNFSGTMNYVPMNLKKLLHQASLLNVKYCLIFGNDEIVKQEIIVKNMISGEQKKVHINKIIELLQLD